MSNAETNEQEYRAEIDRLHAELAEAHAELAERDAGSALEQLQIKLEKARSAVIETTNRMEAENAELRARLNRYEVLVVKRCDCGRELSPGRCNICDNDE